MYTKWIYQTEHFSLQKKNKKNIESAKSHTEKANESIPHQFYFFSFFFKIQPISFLFFINGNSVQHIVKCARKETDIHVYSRWILVRDWLQNGKKILYGKFYQPNRAKTFENACCWVCCYGYIDYRATSYLRVSVHVRVL